jgi:8-oxo-dGTP diphosphatase
MDKGKKAVENIFGNRLRVRVCGICAAGERLLLVKHQYIGSQGILWAPPGGGIKYGESAEATLRREFKEETGLEIEPEEFLFVNEFIEPPLHAIELFFKVRIKKGELITGIDPEMKEEMQMITEVKYMNFDEIHSMDISYFHSIFHKIHSLSELLNKRGYQR